MKKQLLTYFLIFFTIIGFAQDKSNRPSPPAQAAAIINGKTITIDYSQPSLKDRDFGSSSFHPFGNIWRNGANEATWIEVSDGVTINGKSLAKGKYSFFVIPDQESWTLVFNSTWDQWGAYNYDESKDVMRVAAPTSASSSYSEKYTIKLGDDGKGSLNWGDVTVSFTIE